MGIWVGNAVFAIFRTLDAAQGRGNTDTRSRDRSMHYEKAPGFKRSKLDVAASATG